MYNEINRNKTITWLIVLAFIILIILVGYFFGELSEIGYAGVFIGLLIALPSALIGYYTSDQMVLFMAGAKVVAKKDNPVLYNTIENLAMTAGMPTPKMYIIEDESLNAFATGRDPNHAAMAITRGLLNKLSKVELEGVMAHELSHIKNFDTRLSMIVVIFVGLVVILADLFWRVSFWGRGGSKKNNGGAILLVIGLFFIILSPIAAKILQMALSRNREYLADADAALITRFSQGLAGALRKISGQEKVLAHANSAMNHLYIVSPLDSLEGRERSGWWSNLFATHPPVEERIKKLELMGK